MEHWVSHLPKVLPLVNQALHPDSLATDVLYHHLFRASLGFERANCFPNHQPFYLRGRSEKACEPLWTSVSSSLIQEWSFSPHGFFFQRKWVRGSWLLVFSLTILWTSFPIPVSILKNLSSRTSPIKDTWLLTSWIDLHPFFFFEVNTKMLEVLLWFCSNQSCVFRIPLLMQTGRHGTVLICVCVFLWETISEPMFPVFGSRPYQARCWFSS